MKKMTLKGLLIAGISMLVAACLPHASMAQVPPKAAPAVASTTAPKDSVMKKPAFMPEKQFIASTQLFESDPNDDPILKYAVRLPKNWIKEKSSGAPTSKVIGTTNKNVVRRVARYVSPAEKHRRSFFTVEAQEIDYEIGVRNWFLNYVDNVGLTLETITPPDPAEDFVEAAYVAVEGDVTYGVRIKVYINGDHIVIGRYFVPLELFKAESVMQAQGLDSFHLEGARSTEGIEERYTHGFLDQAYFDYPVSWKIVAGKVLNVERMRATLFVPGVENKLTGQITLNLTSRFLETTIGQEVKKFRDEFKLEGYEISDKIESRTLLVSKDIEETRTEIYKLKPARNYMLSYELWVTAMQSEGYFFIITMITPGRDTEFYQWARNVKAYEIVVSSARQFDAEIDKYQYAQ